MRCSWRRAGSLVHAFLVGISEFNTEDAEKGHRGHGECVAEFEIRDFKGLQHLGALNFWMLAVSYEARRSEA